MRWTRLPQAGTRPVERSSHSVTVIGDKVYLFGGEHDPRVPVGSDVYEYSFTDGTWRVVEAQGEAPSPRVAHAASAVGTVLYVFGGRSGLDVGEGASNDLFTFDTVTRTWKRLDPQGPLPPKRSYHTMAAVGPKIYVFGGCGEAGRLNDLHEYDTETNTWAPLPAPSPSVVPGRGGSCLVPVADKAAGEKAAPRLYVVAGFCGKELDDMHVFSIPNKSWCGPTCPTCSEDQDPANAAAQPPPCPADCTQQHVHAHAASAAARACKLSPRSVFGAVVHACDLDECAHKGAVLAYGGEVDPSDKGHDGAGDFCASLMEYGGSCGGCATTAGGAGVGWHSLEAGGESPGPRGWFAASTTADGRLLVHGGLDGNNERLGDMYVLDLHVD